MHVHALHARLGPGPCRRPLPSPLRHWARGRCRARFRLPLALLLLRTLALAAAARAALRVCAQLRQAAAPVRSCACGPPRAVPAPSTVSAGQTRPRCAPAPAHKAPAQRGACLPLPPPCPPRPPCPPCPLAARGGGLAPTGHDVALAPRRRSTAMAARGALSAAVAARHLLRRRRDASRPTSSSRCTRGLGYCARAHTA